jgi:catechol 2,3-dioxygenase-like lactoylglutathione lyase family enzyme
MRLPLLLLFSILLPAADLPILGIAHVSFQSSNLDASARFYTGVLGFDLAFRQAGSQDSAWFKINDDQFVQLVAVEKTAADRLVEIALQVSDAALAHTLLRARGLNPTALEIRPDGTRATTLTDPDNHRIAFVEYAPNSQQARARGKHLGARRVSAKPWHTGVSVANESRAREFYEQALGFVEIWRGGPEGQPTAWVNVRMPGPRGDYIEYMLHNGPLTRDRLSSMHHICLQVPDIQAGHKHVLAAGIADTDTHKPRIGRIRRWLINLFDPDGTRSELMEPVTVPQ